MLGIEPAANVAEAALERGIPTLSSSSERTRAAARREGKRADLLVGNNVLAQVPDLNDFVAGVRILLADGGYPTLEFPHLPRLIEGIQYDTIYHEHFSYFSLPRDPRIFEAHGLDVFDVEELPTHGGSLRVFATHTGQRAGRRVSGRVELLTREERERAVLVRALRALRRGVDGVEARPARVA